MSFINKTNILIKKNNNDLYYFDLDKDIVFTKISNKTNTLISKKLFDGDYSFVDIWLDTNEKDNIYGVINDKKGKIGTYYLNSKVVIDTVIEGNILNGVYKANDEEKYINNIDLNSIEERELLENIEKYLNDNINHHNHFKNI